MYQSLAGMIAQHSLGSHFETVMDWCKILLSLRWVLKPRFRNSFFAGDNSHFILFYIKSSPFIAENTVKVKWLDCVHNMVTTACNLPQGTRRFRGHPDSTQKVLITQDLHSHHLLTGLGAPVRLRNGFQFPLCWEFLHSWLSLHFCLLLHGPGLLL